MEKEPFGAFQKTYGIETISVNSGGEYFLSIAGQRHFLFHEVVEHFSSKFILVCR